MNADFMEALSALEKDKGIPKNVLLDAIETALVTAYKRNYNNAGNVRVEIDESTGDIHIFSVKRVVEILDNPAEEIEVPDAQKIASYYQEGDILEEEVQPRGFGRIAAQAAKQVVVQRIREAERGMIYEEYVEKENEVLTAIIQTVDPSGLYLELGRSEGFMPQSEFIQGETYQQNDRIKVYLLEVKRSPKGPQVLVSRTHPGLIKRLFEFEVPEIQSGVVQIKSIAREAGNRSKIAVYSSDPHVDPVGACVGPKGIRVERIVAELGNEKIDVIEWSSDPVNFIANALSPAQVLMVSVDEENKATRVIVPDNQLSLAIGKEGQNARLAAKLTGWKIDIKSQSQQLQEMQEQGLDAEMLAMDEAPVNESIQLLNFDDFPLDEASIMEEFEKKEEAAEDIELLGFDELDD